MVKNLPANAGDIGSIPRSGKSPGEGNGNLLQYSCLENPTDRGSWQVTVSVLQRIRHDLGTKEQTVESTCLTGGLAGSTQRYRRLSEEHSCNQHLWKGREEKGAGLGLSQLYGDFTAELFCVGTRGLSLPLSMISTSG